MNLLQTLRRLTDLALVSEPDYEKKGAYPHYSPSIGCSPSSSNTGSNITRKAAAKMGAKSD